MADTVSYAKLTDPANAAQVSQALYLIERGKAGVAGQDPALRPFVNSLIALGANDITRLKGSLRTTAQEDAAQQSLLDRGQPTAAEQEAQQSFLPEFRRDQTPTPTQPEFKARQSLLDRETSTQPSFSFNQETPSRSFQQTRQDLAPTGEFNVFAPSTIYSYQTGTGTKRDKFGQSVPTLSYQYVQPNYSSRPATKEEVKYARDFSNALTLKSTTAKTKGITALGIEIVPRSLYGEFLGGIQILGPQRVVSVSQENATKNLFSKGGKVGKLTGGFVLGYIPTTKGELIKTGIITAVSFGIGAVVRGASLAATNIPKIGSIVSTGIKGVTTYGGIGLLAYEGVKTAVVVSKTSDYFDKGQVLGGTTREITAFGVGYTRGSKGIRNIIARYNRIEIPIESLVPNNVLSGEKSFVTAPTTKHLELFKATTTKFPELTGGQAGGFHTTPSKFFGKGKDITPSAGTSELSGLYVASDVSVYFAGIEGGKYSIIPTLKSITSGDNPAIAFLKPAGFREVGFTGTARKPIVKNGERIKEFAFFDKPAKEGYIDIPRMKPEIEGVARTDAGVYNFESGKYYTTYKGEVLQLDVFKSPIKSKNLKLNTVDLKTSTKFKPSSYSSNLPSRSYLKPFYNAFTSSSKPSSSFKSVKYSPISSSKISSSKGSSIRSPVSSVFSSGKSSRSSISSSKISSSIASSIKRSSSGGSSSTGGGGGSSYGLGSSTRNPPVYSPPFRIKNDPFLKGSSRGAFTVFLRRFGKFKPIGVGVTRRQAFDIGRTAASRTLGATFKIEGFGKTKPVKIKGFTTKRTKEGLLFIEQPKYRLSTGTELKEIQSFKKLKGGGF